MDLQKVNANVMPDIRRAVEDVMYSGRFIGGEVVETFERRFASYIDVKYGVGVGSGSDALKLALMALGIKRGDKVAVPSFSFVSTADAILHVGAIPIFVDIDDTFTMDPNQLEQIISIHRISAIIVVHLYGIPAKMDRILEIAREYRIPIVEDAAQAHGARVGSRMCGSMGTLSCFSFYPSKNLGAFGDGGMVCTNDEKMAQDIKELREYGQKAKYIHTRLGFNSRLDAIQAAVLDVKLDYLYLWNKERRRLAKLYDTLGERTVTEFAGDGAVYHIYPYITTQRNTLLSKLISHNIEALVHYPIPIHRHPYYAKYVTHKLPVTEKMASTELSLPIYQHMNEDDLVQVMKVIKETEK